MIIVDFGIGMGKTKIIEKFLREHRSVYDDKDGNDTLYCGEQMRDERERVMKA